MGKAAFPVSSRTLQSSSSSQALASQSHDYSYLLPIRFLPSPKAPKNSFPIPCLFFPCGLFALVTAAAYGAGTLTGLPMSLSHKLCICSYLMKKCAGIGMCGYAGACKNKCSGGDM